MAAEGAQRGVARDRPAVRRRARRAHRDRTAAAASGRVGRGIGVSIAVNGTRLIARREQGSSAFSRYNASSASRGVSRSGSMRGERLAQRIAVRRRRSGGGQRRRTAAGAERRLGHAQRAAVLLQRRQQRGGAPHDRRRHAGQFARHARPSSARPRPRPPRAGTPRRPSTPSPASYAARAAAARSARSASSWKCVAKMVRQRIAECSASSTAQAMASPSRVAVPRPISSTTTSERGPAWCRIAAVSVISTMKVLRPRARSSAAPTRLNSRSTTPIAAALGRHRQPGLGEDRRPARSAAGRWTCPPCSARSAAARAGPASRSQSFGTNAAEPAERRLHHRMPAGLDQELVAIGHRRAAPASRARRASRADCATSSTRQRVGAGGERVGLRQCRRCTRWAKTARSRAAARSAASADPAVQFGEFGRGEARAVRHALPQRELRDGRAASRPPPAGASIT